MHTHFFIFSTFFIFLFFYFSIFYFFGAGLDPARLSPHGLGWTQPSRSLAQASDRLGT
jgi:hypothetical protein